MRQKKIGQSLFIDIYVVDKNLLHEKNLLRLLKKIIRRICLKPLGQPLVKRLQAKNLDTYYGYSIIQIVKESHLAFHTWPEYSYLAIDIFSCKFFSEKRIIDILRKELGSKQIKLKKYIRMVKFTK